MASRPVRRILYRTLRPGDGHPSRLTVTRPLLRPTRGSNGRAAHSLCSALLRVGFVEPPESPPALVRSYRTVSPLPVRLRRAAIGGLFSVALSCGSPRLGVTQHPALWSPDVPRPGPSRARTRPSGRLATISIVTCGRRWMLCCGPGGLRPPVGFLVTYGRRWMFCCGPGGLRPPVGFLVTCGRRWMLCCGPGGCGLRLASVLPTAGGGCSAAADPARAAASSWPLRPPALGAVLP